MLIIMKKSLFIILTITCTLISFYSSAQTATAWWPFTTKSTATDSTFGCIAASGTTCGSYLNNYGISYTTTYGLRLRQSTITNWPVYPLDSICADFRMNAITGNDIRLDSITFKTCSKQSTDNFLLDIYCQIDSAGKWFRITPSAIPFSNYQIPTAGVLSLNKLPLYNGHSYKFRFYVYALTALSNLEYCYLQSVKFYGNCFTPAVKPTTTTLTANTTDKYSATVSAKFDSSSVYQSVLESGFCWSSINSVPSFSNTHQAFISGASGVISGSVTGLNPATTYFIRSYIITQLDTIYSNVKSFTTLPYSVPVLFTNTTFNIKSYKALSGGYGTIGTNLLDSGGYNITQKGIVYTVAPAIPTTAYGSTTLANPSFGNASFTNCLMSGLLPNTKYYVRAFATNQLGTGYGNIDSFTTFPATAALSATPPLLDFGNIIYNANSPVLSYVLKAINLPVDTSNIYINFTAQYQISLSPNGPFTAVSPLVIPYVSTGATISKVVYVKLSTGLYGVLNNAITHSCYAVSLDNSDTINVAANVIQSPATITNRGTDFWTGYGFQQQMRVKPGGIDSVLGLSYYVTSKGQSANILVDIPMFTAAQKIAFGYPKTYTVPADSTIEVKGFPVGDLNDVYNAAMLPDARLYFTGVSNRGIHIVATNGVPVTIVQHIWAKNNSAGATLLSPVNSLGTKYIVQSYGGKTNTGPGNSFFFAVATKDSTIINFIPGGDILDSSTASLFSYSSTITTANIKYHKGQNYYVTLNKGQVFNAMSFIDANSGLSSDLSGTVIQSIDSTKPIAVYGGNGRTIVDTTTANPPVFTASTGSDNLLQQMLPFNLWGTKYLTAPTKTMEYNYYRIYVKDSITNVYLNGNLLDKSKLFNGIYYQFAGNRFNTITSDLPVFVTQFIVTGTFSNAALGNNGTGDPEMINLTPVNMGIKSVKAYTTYFKVVAAGAAFVNVIIPKNGVSSFSLNNTALADTGGSSYIVGAPYNAGTQIPVANAFNVHPADSNYYYARFRVPYPATFSMSSDSSFTGIVYGLTNGESYGYNLGYEYSPNAIPITVDTPIAGLVVTPVGKPVSGVVASYYDSAYTVITDSSGSYIVPANYAKSAIHFNKTNDINKANGVTAIDIALIQAHVLGKNNLNSPYKVIAADVSGDGKVTALDIVYIKRLILGVDTAFTNSKTGRKSLWTFVNSAVAFADSTNPFPYTDSIQLNNTNGVVHYPDMMAIKLGDVNWDWNPVVARMPNPVFVRPENIATSDRK